MNKKEVIELLESLQGEGGRRGAGLVVVVVVGHLTGQRQQQTGGEDGWWSCRASVSVRLAGVAQQIRMKADWGPCWVLDLKAKSFSMVSSSR